MEYNSVSDDRKLLSTVSSLRRWRRWLIVLLLLALAALAFCVFVLMPSMMTPAAYRSSVAGVASEQYIAGRDSGYEDGRSDGYDDGYAEGSSAGYSKGYAKGESAGYNKGYADGAHLGYEDGYADGYDVGYVDGYTASSPSPPSSRAPAVVPETGSTSPISIPYGHSADEIVYVSDRSGTIHSDSDCSGMKYYTRMTLEEALVNGFTHYCEHCF